MQRPIIGWDIGGAHVKAALLSIDGNIKEIAMHPCPLWQGLPYLRDAVSAVMQQVGPGDYIHAVTMTGELVDLFTDRFQGVKEIVRTLQQCLADSELWIFAGKQGFIASDKLNQVDCLAIASMNWYASASMAAQQGYNGLFVDIGSTTTDILLIHNGKLLEQGLTDYERLVYSELVYTGVVRTAVMAVASKAEFRGRPTRLMAEYFATMADVYRLTTELNEDHDHSDSADGEAKTMEASARRLSRMTGYDFQPDDMELWHEFAREIRRQQKELIKEACLEQVSRLSTHHDTKLHLIGAGIGRFLARDIAVESDWTYLDFNDLIPGYKSLTSIDAADCAPAVAVACLLNSVEQA
jgi:(4-(4-[2-(gamma-L-glutamylamino)ethyl]phenoxymethyl)furan-2-yl)methanamine synthase